MEIIKPNYYNDFSCLAGSCPATCCAHWEVVIDEKALRYYDTVDGDIGRLIRNAMTEIDGDICFGLNDGNCRMLQPDGLCEIQKELGHDALCKSCARYPRFLTEVGLRREIGISLSCPEAARLILTATEPFTLCRELTDEPMTALHEISPELIITLRSLYSRAIGGAQDKMLSFSRRCIAILQLAASCRTRVRSSNLEQCQIQTDATPAQTGGMEQFRKALHKTIAGLEPLQPEFQQTLLRALELPLSSPGWQELMPELPMLWEQLLCYGIYKYVPRAMFDGAVWPAAVFALLLPLLLRQLIRSEGTQDVASLLHLAWSLSRELEHSEENMEKLWQAFSRREFRPNVLQAIFAAIEA